MKDMIKSLMAAQEKELKKITPTLMEIKQTNSNIESSISFLAAQNEELKLKVEKLERENKKDKEYITLLEEKLEDIQRENRKTNIEIKNVPKTTKETNEDLINMVLSLSKTINCNLSKADLRDVYRMKGKKEGINNTPIIVETSSTMLKTAFLAKCKTFNIKNKEKLRAKHMGLTGNDDTPIFVSEQLTPKAARLFFIARELTKSKAYSFCWTGYGRVYIRKTENSPVILIKNEFQVQSLMQKD
ncbi:uncharacterized protein LOC124542604 [Vanessa cardui]|uniref:uncharacterized protein LOC124542604 n=1 Tax=Vanessa cardui TaxID=171605 RepID=UPI001F1446DF|nr:uncharacterized protein LOC124542604 [Vanessa cardui]